MKHSIAAALAAMLLVLTALPVRAAVVTENWDLGAGSWEPNTTRTILEWRPDGGVGDSGYLFTAQTETGFLVAGARSSSRIYVGDYAAKDYNLVGCDLQFFAGRIDSVFFRARYLDSSYGGWHVPLTDDFTPGTWQTCEVTFDPLWTDDEARAAGWVQEAAAPSFQETMANVFTAEIRILGGLDLEVGIDNLRLGNPTTCRSMLIDPLESMDLDSGLVLGLPSPQVDFSFYEPSKSAPLGLAFIPAPQREVSFLDGVAFATVQESDVVGVVFDTDPGSLPLDYDDTVLVRTEQGRYFKVGRAVNGGLGTAEFCYEELFPEVSGVDEGSGTPRPGLAGRVEAHPNPFNPRTTITFSLDREGFATVTIHDMRGRLVRKLARATFSAGDQALPWNGRDDTGRAVPSGAYFVKVDAGGASHVGRMMLLR